MLLFLHGSTRVPVEKLSVIEASQSSLNQSSDAADESDHVEQPPPSYNDVIQDQQLEGNAPKYETQKSYNSI